MTSSIDLEDYLEKHSSTEDAILKKIYRETNIRMLNPRMVTGHLQGQFLAMLSKMIKPDLILEIGTFTGYSAICLSKGLSPGGMLHTIEINDEIAEIAVDNIKLAGIKNKIEIHKGNALEVVPLLNKKFDLIFIDGEKKEYPEYYKICCRYLKVGGYLIADNILWNGKVLETESNFDVATKAISDFNNLISSNKNFEKTFLPIRDGLLIALLKQ